MRSLALLAIGPIFILCCFANDPGTTQPTKSARSDKDPCPDLSWVESAPISPPLPDRSRELLPRPKETPTANDLAWAKVLMSRALALSDAWIEEEYLDWARGAYELSGNAEALFMIAQAEHARNQAHAYVAFTLYAERIGAAIDPAHAKIIEETLPFLEKRSVSLDVVCQVPGFEIELDYDVLGVSPIAATWRANSQSRVTITAAKCGQTKDLTFTNVHHTAIVCSLTSR